jgi:hypothetical protein
LNLPPGTHRIKFIVDDEWKCSTELSAATDAEGNLVNFLEVADEEQDELEGGYGNILFQIDSRYFFSFSCSMIMYVFLVGGLTSTHHTIPSPCA